MPLKSFPCMVSVQVLVPAVLKIITTDPDCTPLNVTKVPVTVPIWLLLILIATPDGEVLRIPLSPATVTKLNPSMELLFILTVAVAAADWL